jgi:hypothetical protein
VRRLGLVLTGFDVHFRGRLDPNIDVFRKPIDDLKAFGERGATLELKGKAELLLTESPEKFAKEFSISALCVSATMRQAFGDAAK